MVWWQENYLLWENFKNQILEFPLLELKIKGEKIFLEGSWEVYGEEILIVTYQISIEVPDDFPNKTPKVYEISELLPKIQNRHFNPKDKTACLFISTEQPEHWPLGSDIKLFLNKPVKEFFFSQAYFDLIGEWPFGEWAHGDDGLIDYCIQYLGISKRKQLANFFRYLELKKPAKIKCPCDSGKYFKLCHWDKFSLLTKRLPFKEWLRFSRSLSANK